MFPKGSTSRRHWESSRPQNLRAIGADNQYLCPHHGGRFGVIALIAVRLKNAFGGRLPHIARIPRGSRSRFGRAWRRWKAVRCARGRKLTRVSGIRIGLIREVSWLSWQRAGRERLQWQGLPSSAATRRVRLRSSLRHKVCRRVPRCEASRLWSTERRQ